MGLENVPRCQHVKMNGTQCGSPALRRRRHCFFHDRIRREQAKIAAQASILPTFELPLLEDANCVQVALMKVIQMLASGRMDHKTAGLILYALQTAAVNLRQADFEPNDVSDVVIDRDTVAATCINGPQWCEEDFDDEDDEEVEGEEDGEEENEDEDEEEGDEEDENENENEKTRKRVTTRPPSSLQQKLSPARRSLPKPSPSPRKKPAGRYKALSRIGSRRKESRIQPQSHDRVDELNEDVAQVRCRR